ncbi:ABC transporter substrate-binding protein [Hoyosella altamirensis]|uniref:ABC transporter substrate-binding protein n=1 Tax=Hoyosella altamirensis TaxID=616997 RepID=UPI0007DB2902|nr:ABC transporter substrate-binding protein [Hoyosella altamirensis]
MIVSTPVRAAGAATCALTVVLTGCGTQAAESASQTIVLADGHALGGYNPVAGYGPAGEAKMYDGLLRLSGGEGLPGFEPALAAELPEPNSDATSWTVTLREGVSFHDGSAFGAEDVVATYTSILDPASASEVRSSFDMIEAVEALDETTVRFTLAYSYAAFPTKLLIGIVPSESVAERGLAAESSLNSDPIGTGPYRLTGLSPDRAVLEANEDYWGGTPEVERITLLYVPDDNTRAQRMATGEFDGTSLPPQLAATFADREDMSVQASKSADWRGVSMPTGDLVTGDPALRQALNHAVNRNMMIDNILAGHGRAAYTPFPEVYGDAHNPAATFSHDPELAGRLLDEAGWERGPDGIRVKDGQRAEFTVMYNSADTVRRDLSQAFASDALAIGVEVSLEALSWDRITPRIDTDAILIGGGDEPFDPDTQAYKTLHSAYLEPDVGSVYDNASRHANAVVDEELDRARRSTDPVERATAYRVVQEAYIDDPSYVFLAFLDHVYVSRDSDWAKPPPVLEPHSHGVTWGPWWSVNTWTRSR